MESYRYFGQCSVCFIAFVLRVTIGAPMENIDCNVTVEVEVAECCSLKQNGAPLREPLIPYKCSSILLNVEKAPTQEEFESAMECFLECLFSTADMLNQENKVDSDQLLLNLTKELTPNSKELSLNSIKNCIEKDYEVKGTSQCRSGSLQFFLCVQRENTLNCPSEHWTNSAGCNKYKSLLEKCPKRTPISGLFNLT